MLTVDQIRNRNDLDVRWTAGSLLDALGFETRVRGRLAQYVEQRGLELLSLRELMDLFLPRFQSLSSISASSGAISRFSTSRNLAVTCMTRRW